jgi:HEAT repeats
MRTLMLVVLQFVLIGLVSAEPTPKATPEQRVVELIRQLGSDDFDKREQAAKALQTIGPAALEQLRKAVQSDDPEVRRAAAELVSLLEQQALTTGLLAPRRLRLDLKDASIPDAVAQLARASGYPVVLAGGQDAYADRKVTLQTGEVTFWDALHQLCQQAGLEETPAPPQPADAVPLALPPVVLKRGEAGAVNRAVHVAGSVRVRIQGIRREGDSLLVPMELLAEPRLQAFRASDKPIIVSAIDEHGQKLSTTVSPGDVSGLIRLKMGDKPATRLRELTGRVLVEAIVTTDPVLTVPAEKVVAGTSHKGKEGPTLHVTSLERRDNGDVQLGVGVEGDQAGVPGLGGNIVIRGNGRIIIRGGAVRIGAGGMVVDGKPQPPPALPQLLDADSRPFQLVQIADQSLQLQAGRVTRSYSLVYKPADPKAKAAKLVLFGQKPVTFEATFTFRDVDVK